MAMCVFVSLTPSSLWIFSITSFVELLGFFNFDHSKDVTRAPQPSAILTPGKCAICWATSRALPASTVTTT